MISSSLKLRGNSRAWPRVPLGEVLIRSKEQVDILSDRMYTEVSVRLWGKGVVKRREVTGAEIAAVRRSLARPGQLVLSRIDARNGALGMVPEELDGAVTSNDFPSYDLDQNRVAPGFLGWMVRTPWFVELCQKASEGTTNRVRLQEKRFLALPIPLPPLSEQRRIVARIEELTAKIEEARSLRGLAVVEAEALLASAYDRAFLPKVGWRLEPVRAFCDAPQYGYTASASSEAVGPRLLRITDIQDGEVDWMTVPYCICPDPDRHLLKPGDLVFARTGATTGKSFVIGECPKTVFASYLIRLRVRSAVTVDYLYRYFQSPGYWRQIADEKKGTGQPNLNGSKLAGLLVPIAPPAEQRRIVAYLDGLQAKVGEVRRLQAETQSELDALLPSILDKAFKGEL